MTYYCFSRGLDLHDKYLQEVFDRLRKYQIKLNGLKCQFAVNNVKFIGHSITKAGIGPDSEKVRSMLEYPRPSNTKSLRSFQGMMQFYKRYILHFSKIAAPPKLSFTARHALDLGPGMRKRIPTVALRPKKCTNSFLSKRGS